ncbi:MAG: HEAT repeat domain-containing protein [Deltaproteobacteria bacterium]|nr:HEAT repeat domain-containing protein [Deltaproteobacteria bacterium]
MHRIGMASKHLLEPGLTKLVKKGDRIYIVSVLGILELDEDGRFVGLEPFERLLEFDLNAVSIAQFIWNNLRRNTGSLMQKHHQFLEVSLRHTESIVRTAAFLLLNNVEEELTDLPKERLVDFSKALYHADDDFKFFIIRVLGNQTMLKNEGIFPEETLAPIVKSLGDSYDLIPGCAGAILHDIKNLPFEILKAIVPFVSRGSFDETRKGTIWANETRKGALYALENRENLPAEILHDLAFDFLRGDIKVGDILDEQIRLSLETLHLLINKYSDRREDVREKVLKILVWQRMTPQIVQVLVQSLSDPYAQVRKTAATALDQNRYLSQDILTIIIRRLFSDEKDAEIRSWLAQILASQCELSVNIVNVLAQQFSAEDIWNRRNATYALKWQRKLSNEILDQVAPLLLDADSNVRSNAARIFSSQETALNEKYLPALVQYLWSGDSPNDAYGALRNQPGFPQTIYNSFAQKLNDPDSIVREWAAGVLEDNKQHMPLDILKALAKLAFDDENKKVALEASIALADQMSVPAEIFDIIADKLEHKDSRIRSRAIVALKNKENVSIEILRTLLKHFDQDANVRISAAYTFESYKNLPQEILDHIALLLEDEDPMMREMALKSLHNKDKLRGDMIKTVISLLADEFKDIKYYAVQVIESQSSLSKETMTVLDNLLSDPDYFYRVLAMNILGRHENVPQNILNKILLRLTDKDSSVRQAAMVTLAHQPYLSKGQINSIAQVLKDKRDYIRSDIADELKEFKQLPEEILNALVLCLSDSDVYVQISASEALAAQEKLPEDIRKKLEDFQNN